MPPEFCFVRVIVMQRRTVPKVCGIERKIGGQCDCGIGIFESIQIKTILNYEFEIVLNIYLKRSKSSQGNACKSGLSCYRMTVSINPCRAISISEIIIGSAVVVHLGAHSRCDRERRAARLQRRRGATQIRATLSDVAAAPEMATEIPICATT
jgi:hypothetical protein